MRAWIVDMSRRFFLTLTMQFTLQNSSTGHDLGYFFSKCKEICLLHCHPHKLRKKSQGWDFLSICVQSSSKCQTAALQILPYCCEISNYHYLRKSENRKYWDLQRVIQAAIEKEFSTSKVLPAVFLSIQFPIPLQVPHNQRDQWPAIMLQNLNFMLPHSI